MSSNSNQNQNQRNTRSRSRRSNSNVNQPNQPSQPSQPQTNLSNNIGGTYPSRFQPMPQPNQPQTNLSNNIGGSQPQPQPQSNNIQFTDHSNYLFSELREYNQQRDQPLSPLPVHKLVTVGVACDICVICQEEFNPKKNYYSCPYECNTIFCQDCLRTYRISEMNANNQIAEWKSWDEQRRYDELDHNAYKLYSYEMKKGQMIQHSVDSNTKPRTIDMLNPKQVKKRINDFCAKCPICIKPDPFTKPVYKRGTLPIANEQIKKKFKCTKCKKVIQNDYYACKKCNHKQLCQECHDGDEITTNIRLTDKYLQCKKCKEGWLSEFDYPFIPEINKCLGYKRQFSQKDLTRESVQYYNNNSCSYCPNIIPFGIRDVQQLEKRRSCNLTRYCKAKYQEFVIKHKKSINQCLRCKRQAQDSYDGYCSKHCMLDLDIPNNTLQCEICEKPTFFGERYCSIRCQFEIHQRENPQSTSNIIDLRFDEDQLSENEDIRVIYDTFIPNDTITEINPQQQVILDNNRTFLQTRFREEGELLTDQQIVQQYLDRPNNITQEEQALLPNPSQNDNMCLRHNIPFELDEFGCFFCSQCIYQSPQPTNRPESYSNIQNDQTNNIGQNRPSQPEPEPEPQHTCNYCHTNIQLPNIIQSRCEEVEYCSVLHMRDDQTHLANCNECNQNLRICPVCRAYFASITGYYLPCFVCCCSDSCARILIMDHDCEGCQFRIRVRTDHPNN